MSLEDFDSIVNELKLLDKVRSMIEKGMNGIDVKDIESIECIGGASRVRNIQSLVA